jgi:hypothetical protein
MRKGNRMRIGTGTGTGTGTNEYTDALNYTYT